ncbi:hypothetical protein PGT21_010697 [Puccinia graminis f. sp. tritici]|uniref:Uncharacterized protein n=1 Tax=Puccinia graminis f. sp. tritici TaxID=56615 RepID=A0A5B0LT05_PUCGR|nr:hypothetical protein PGTUg99_023206 [Puccinia graminis f. sp. tritici]KAA1083891.1 hypothetical protein PGT21_010697 [Puccinia graminis f. sp. tritici]
MPPSLPPTLTTVTLKFDKTTVLLPATKKTRVSELKTGFLEALKGTKTSPSNGSLEDSSCFQIFRASKTAANLTEAGSAGGAGGGPADSWDALADDHATMSDLALEEAETLGIGFKNSKGSYDQPLIEIWREQETRQL